MPINTNDSHWLLPRVPTAKKRIKLWDSLGSNPSNQHYLESTRRYSYDSDGQSTDRTNPQFREWVQNWWCLDRSCDSTPRRGNEYDCGVFTVHPNFPVRSGSRCTAAGLHVYTRHGILPAVSSLTRPHYLVRRHHHPINHMASRPAGTTTTNQQNLNTAR